MSVTARRRRRSPSPVVVEKIPAIARLRCGTPGTGARDSSAAREPLGLLRQLEVAQSRCSTVAASRTSTSRRSTRRRPALPPSSSTTRVRASHEPRRADGDAPRRRHHLAELWSPVERGSSCGDRKALRRRTSRSAGAERHHRGSSRNRAVLQRDVPRPAGRRGSHGARRGGERRFCARGCGSREATENSEKPAGGRARRAARRTRRRRRAPRRRCATRAAAAVGTPRRRAADGRDGDRIASGRSASRRGRWRAASASSVSRSAEED